MTSKIGMIWSEFFRITADETPSSADFNEKSFYDREINYGLPTRECTFPSKRSTRIFGGVID